MARPTEHSAYALARHEGTSIWFLGTLVTVKAGAEATRNGFTLVEQLLPPGFAPPPHVHHAEEEAFYILEGLLAVTCGDQTWRVGPGSFVLLPRGIAHTFRVEGAEAARLLQITSPAGFERFAQEVGEPARALALPPMSGSPDLEKLLAAAARHDIEIQVSPPDP